MSAPEFKKLGEQIVAEAWAAFDWWCQVYDPEGEHDFEERLKRYGDWCDAGNRAPASGCLGRMG